MLEVFEKTTRFKTAILQNAHSISECVKLNAVSTLQFALPYNDMKNAYCRPFDYVRLDGGDLYRIMDDGEESSDNGSIVYKCEHVLATLIDKVLFGYHVIGNIGTYTADVIRYILSFQSDWVLGDCDFNHQFEYGWEQENLLSALFSVPKPFAEEYIWTFDTKHYPWTINLKKIDRSRKPGLYVRRSHNLLKLSRDQERTSICTKLYPLGYGEGVNQLNICSVNDGLPYLLAPQSIIDQYGIVERVWVDRRYENAESLKAAAQSMLDELQEPLVQWSVDAAHLVYSANDARTAPGEVVRIIDTERGVDFSTIITQVDFEHGEIPKATLTIANKQTDIASLVADLADRQRIEQTYSQGATQLYAQSIQENADKDSGAVMDFFIPSEMRIINKVLCKVRVGSFRAYSKATSTFAQQSSTSSSGGGSTATSSSGGGTDKSTDSGGGDSVTSGSGGSTTKTSTSGGSVNKSSGTVQGVTSSTTGSASISTHRHTIGTSYTGYAGSSTHTHTYGVGAHTHNITLNSHTHDISIPSHTHSVKIPSHSHDFTVPAHNHTVSVPSHTHSFTIPGHEHNITPVIQRFGAPKSFNLYVNNVKKASFVSNNEEIDLTPYLIDEDSGIIRRGIWQSIEVRPNDLAYISISLSIQGFVQSRGDATV